MEPRGWSGNLEMCLAEDPRLSSDIYPDCWPYRLCLGEGQERPIGLLAIFEAREGFCIARIKRRQLKKDRRSERPAAFYAG